MEQRQYQPAKEKPTFQDLRFLVFKGIPLASASQFEHLTADVHTLEQYLVNQLRLRLGLPSDVALPLVVSVRLTDEQLYEDNALTIKRNITLTARLKADGYGADESAVDKLDAALNVDLGSADLLKPILRLLKLNVVALDITDIKSEQSIIDAVSHSNYYTMIYGESTKHFDQQVMDALNDL